jgi:hypothetical protein
MAPRSAMIGNGVKWDIQQYDRHARRHPSAANRNHCESLGFTDESMVKLVGDHTVCGTGL